MDPTCKGLFGGDSRPALRSSGSIHFGVWNWCTTLVREMLFVSERKEEPDPVAPYSAAVWLSSLLLVSLISTRFQCAKLEQQSLQIMSHVSMYKFWTTCWGKSVERKGGNMSLQHRGLNVGVAYRPSGKQACPSLVSVQVNIDLFNCRRILFIRRHEQVARNACSRRACVKWTFRCIHLSVLKW